MARLFIFLRTCSKACGPHFGICNTKSTMPEAEHVARPRCRYKTGRCPNPRAVKANGTLLLLCEYHRHQQNRTKKRSDMKCRHDRAKKRQLQRAKGFKNQEVAVDQEGNALCGCPLLSSLASTVAPREGDAVALEKSSSSRKLETTPELTSPTAVDFDLSSMSWTLSSPTLVMEGNSLALEEIWLLEYFIL